MAETVGREAPSPKKNGGSEVHVVVEVDGAPVGFLDLDVERLWTVIDHRKRESAAIEWIDRTKFDAILRAAVVKRLISRLEANLYQVLGNEIVKAELDIETVKLKAENAAKLFGRTKAEVEKSIAESGRSMADFLAFFWEHLLDERENVDLKKEWKAARK